MKQCCWCKAIQNIHTGEWQDGPAEVLPETSGSICPDCSEKIKKEYSKIKQKRGKAA